MRRKFTLLATIICAVLLVVLFTGILQSVEITKASEKLTQSEIEILREEYPLYSGTSPLFNTDRPFTPIDEMKEICDTFVLCEVVGDSYSGMVNTTTGDVEFDEKLESNGLGYIKTYYFPVKILSDTEGIMPEGFEFAYSFSEYYVDFIPFPKIGTKLIVPLSINGISEKKYSPAHSTMFYVTDDDYVLAVYNSDAESLTGVKVKELMEKLKKTSEQKEKYLELRKWEYESTNGRRGFSSVENLKKEVKEDLTAKKNAEK